MTTHNDSTAPTETLSILLDFVAARFSAYAHLLEVRFHSGGRLNREGRYCMTGHTSWTDDKKIPFVISIGVPAKDGTYPSAQRLFPIAPEIKFEHAAEELVAVLAHEFQHVVQMCHSMWAIGQEVMAEIDAELTATRVLDEYRALPVVYSCGIKGVEVPHNVQVDNRAGEK